MKIADCLESNKANGVNHEDCMYSDFLAYMDKISQKGDLDELCYQTFVAPQ